MSLEGVFGNKTYVMDASGNASPKDADNAFYWKNTDEARVSAWTPDIESETDISDQSGGYAAFDVLYATGLHCPMRASRMFCYQTRLPVTL